MTASQYLDWTSPPSGTRCLWYLFVSIKITDKWWGYGPARDRWSSRIRAWIYPRDEAIDVPCVRLATDRLVLLQGFANLQLVRWLLARGIITHCWAWILLVVGWGEAWLRVISTSRYTSRTCGRHFSIYSFACTWLKCQLYKFISLVVWWFIILSLVESLNF